MASLAWDNFGPTPQIAELDDLALKRMDGVSTKDCKEIWCCPGCKQLFPPRRNLLVDLPEYECPKCHHKNPTTHNWKIPDTVVQGVPLEFMVYDQGVGTKYCVMYSSVTAMEGARRVRGALCGISKCTAFDVSSALETYKMKPEPEPLPFGPFLLLPPRPRSGAPPPLRPMQTPATTCGAHAASAFAPFPRYAAPPGSFVKPCPGSCRRAPRLRLVAPMASTVDSPGSSSDFVKRIERAWLISQQPKPISCSSCQSAGHVECKWCAGTGFFILGNNMLCEVPSRNTKCVICSGKGIASCADCQGTGFRAKWLEEPPVDK